MAAAPAIRRLRSECEPDPNPPMLIGAGSRAEFTRARLLRFLIATLIVFAVLMVARRRLRAVAGARQPAAGRRRGGDRRARRRRSASIATRSASPPSSATSREDVARALGFVHAQDRFFQMDLQRRQPAGELSALVGPRALDVDRGVARASPARRRASRLRARPSRRIARVLEAYADGVNAGLQRARRRAAGIPGAARHAGTVAARRHHPHRARHVQHAAGPAGAVRTDHRRDARCAARADVSLSLGRTDRNGTHRWSAMPVSRPPIPGPEVFDLRNRRPQRHRDSEPFL